MDFTSMLACGEVAFTLIGMTKPKHVFQASKLGSLVLVGGTIGAFHILTNFVFQTGGIQYVAGLSTILYLVLVSLSYYDNSRGELSPRWRNLGHGPKGMLEELFMSAHPFSLSLAVVSIGLRFLKPEIIVLAFLPTALLNVKVLLGRPASYPGDPRAHRIMREPNWQRKWESSHVPVETGWVFAEARKSHEVTEKAVNNGHKLQGEAAGRQMWYFDGKEDGSKESDSIFNADKNPNSADKLFRKQRIANWKRSGGKVPRDNHQPASSPLEAARRGLEFYQMIQCDDGHWAGDYGGPMFLMPGLIMVWYITGKRKNMISPAMARAMVIYLRNHQQADGGWGTHIESPSTMFGSTLNYVAMRLLGVSADDPAMKAGRDFIHTHGGALYTSSWAKLWLCVLGVMDWQGHNPVPPEMWLLPHWIPFHPGRLWCHCRMVYLPMCFLYGSKYVYEKAETDPLIQDLRTELYSCDYKTIRWDSTRFLVADIDNYSPVGTLMFFAQHAIRYLWEGLGGPLLKYTRKEGLKFVAEYMDAEDLQTNFVDIGPVNKALNMLCCYARGETQSFEKHLLRVPDYLWVAEDGMKMQGYNGSQCWDTSFAVQAVAACGFGNEFEGMIQKAYGFLERTQILSTEVSKSSPAFQYESQSMRQQYFRHVSQGGWPFSTSAHGWPISDCTGEGLKAMLVMKDLKCITQWNQAPYMDDRRYFDACNVVLTLQNSDGGFATYENNRGYGWYEWLNPSEVFGDIMIDYSYVECTNASIGALAAFHNAFPHHRTAEVVGAIRRARQFLLDLQRDDGSWYGSWGCCFTYASWFGVEGLLQAGEPQTSPAIRKACRFLLSHQNKNGGWGEDFTSCFDKAYAPDGMKAFGDGGSGVVNTGWALLSLMAAGCEDADAVKRGIEYLISKQMPDGDWPQEGIAGVFNRACGITYTAYRNVFPIWALGRYVNEYIPELAERKRC